jgi:hypothetical protein
MGSTARGLLAPLRIALSTSSCGRLEAEAAKPRSTRRTVSRAASSCWLVDSRSDEGPSERCTTPLPCRYASTCS